MTGERDRVNLAPTAPPARPGSRRRPPGRRPRFPPRDHADDCLVATTQRVVLRTEPMMPPRDGSSVAGRRPRPRFRRPPPPPPPPGPRGRGCRWRPPSRPRPRVPARLADLDAVDLVRTSPLRCRAYGAEETTGCRRRSSSKGGRARPPVVRGKDHLDSRHVHEPRFELLRGWAPGDHPAPPCVRSVSGTLIGRPTCTVLGCLLDELLHRQRLKSWYMTSTIGRIPATAAPIPAHDRHLRDRRVPHPPVGAALVELPCGHAHRAAHLGDGLAHDEDVLVPPIASLIARARPRGSELRHRRLERVFRIR